MSGYTNTGAGAGGQPTLGERIAQAVPGTEAYRETHGVTGAHQNVEGLKSHIPGTEEHRMREAGVVGGGGGVGHNAGGAHGHQGVGMGERVKQAVPGTREHEATHGMTGAHQGAQQLKSHVPGTEEHHLRTGMEGTGYGAGTGAGLGGMGTGHHTTGTGYNEGGMGHTTTGTTGYTEGGHKGLGQRVKEMVPGTREHEEKKMEQGRI